MRQHKYIKILKPLIGLVIIIAMLFGLLVFPLLLNENKEYSVLEIIITLSLIIISVEWFVSLIRKKKAKGNYKMR